MYLTQVIDMDKGPINLDDYRASKGMPISSLNTGMRVEDMQYLSDAELDGLLRAFYRPDKPEMVDTKPRGFLDNVYETILEHWQDPAFDVQKYIEGLTFLFRRNPDAIRGLNEIHEKRDYKDPNTKLGMYYVIQRARDMAA